MAALGAASLYFPPLRNAIGIVLPDAGEFAQERALFSDALGGANAGALAGSAQSLGFAAQAIDDAWQGTLLAEPDGTCVGRGVYLAREAAKTPLALTAPHRGSDRHTGTLAAQMFTDSNAAAAAWNSAPRRPSEECPNALDLAREEQHPFTAFALSFAEEYPEGRIVQLHGFERSKRDDALTRSAGVILSDGTDAPSDRLLNLADCLTIALAPYPVLVYPHEAQELGALTNAQGAALRQQGFAGFVHLELSAELREELLENATLRGQLTRCLEDMG